MKNTAIAIVVLGLAAGVSLATAAEGQGCRQGAEIVQQAFDGAEGSLDFEAVYGIESESLTEGRVQAGVRLSLPLETLRLIHGPEGRAVACVTVVTETSEGLEPLHQVSFTAAYIDEAKGFEYGVDFPLPEDAAVLIATFELPALGLWGAIAADESDVVLPPRPADARALGDPDGAWYRIIAPPDPAMRPTDNRSATALQIVPPRRQPVSGATRVYALASDPDIARVVFYLDGKLVGARKSQPFFASIPFTRPAKPQTVRAVAFDRGSRQLGSSEIVVNPVNAPFRVRIRELEGDPSAGEVEVVADVAVPTGTTLERVEVWSNATRVATLTEPPFRARIATRAPTPTDFIRVAAFLEDGQSIDDVVLLGDPSLIEEIDVNLVPLYVVVRGADGRPVSGLDSGDFTLTLGNAEQPIETFAVADDVPLVLGLVIDTSGSMALVIEDTRRAAVGFLQGVIEDRDRGFVVDFDRQPRLRQPTTGDTVDLLRAIGGLEAIGQTSLYDAIVFSMLQFEREGARRALVVLTDGADRDSRFGPKDCIEYGERLGVPIYLIAMHTHGREKFPKRELTRIGDRTGGGLYLIDSIADLPATYTAIETELRSQYALGFYTDEDLGAEARRGVDVTVDVPGADVRVVVGSGGSGIH